MRGIIKQELLCGPQPIPRSDEEMTGTQVLERCAFMLGHLTVNELRSMGVDSSTIGDVLEVLRALKNRHGKFFDKR